MCWWNQAWRLPLTSAGTGPLATRPRQPQLRPLPLPGLSLWRAMPACAGGKVVSPVAVHVNKLQLWDPCMHVRQRRNWLAAAYAQR